ncbi:MAG: MarR family transcriptional regulator [Variovorax sp.]|nr:MarR family transcriptional regulator [Variovorax sp.]
MTGHDHDPALPGGLDHSKLLVLLGYNLAQASIPTGKIFQTRIGKPLALTQVEFSVLLLIHSNPGVTGKQLCQSLATAAARMSLVLDRLMGRGLIDKEQSGTDKRVQHLRLSKAGQRLADKALAIAGTMETDLLRRLSKGEQAMLMEMLLKIASSGREPG